MRIHLNRSERGAAAVELALVLPLLFLVLFGIVEFGFIFNKQLSVTHAAREGVRVYAVEGNPTSAVTFAQSSSGMNPPPNCSASPMTPPPSGDPVSITCTTTYNLQLYFFKRVVTLTSTAQARRE